MSIRFRTFKSSAAFLLAASMVGAGQANENSQEEANLKKALYCMEVLENRPDLEPSARIEILRDECFAENYIQHSPHVEDGRDAVLKLFERRFKNHSETTTSIKRTASQGDLVWMHQHVQRSPEDRGRAVVNIFRMEDGKFAEHWNVIQAVPEKSKNDNGMF